MTSNPIDPIRNKYISPPGPSPIHNNPSNLEPASPLAAANFPYQLEPASIFRAAFALIDAMSLLPFLEDGWGDCKKSKKSQCRYPSKRKSSGPHSFLFWGGGGVSSPPPQILNPFPCDRIPGPTPGMPAPATSSEDEGRGRSYVSATRGREVRATSRYGAGSFPATSAGYL